VSLEANKDVIRTYVETIFNQKQVDRADELVAPDFIDHAALPGQAPGLEGAKQKWAMYLAGIPDLRVTIEEMVAEGDKVGVRRSYGGTHRGELLGVPPTGGSCWVSRPPGSRCESAVSASSGWPGGRSPSIGSSWIGWR
jgi:predicted ester cyclase